MRDELTRLLGHSHDCDYFKATSLDKHPMGLPCNCPRADILKRWEEMEAELERNCHQLKVLRVIVEHELDEGIFWNRDLDPFVNCSDMFWWGTADGEPLDDLDAFEEAIRDGGDDWGKLLYCARRREMRPQGAAYKYIPENLWPLFDACGPHRPADFTNPVATP